MATRTAALVPLLTGRPPATADSPATDRDLLRRFARHNDEAAFATIVHRHGAMVLGVCNRVLGNPADAEDACQATFVILARKAAAGRWQPSVASWLYATARRVALNARTARARRAKHEGRAAAKPQPGALAQITGEELLAILDEELGRLPERYRAAVVLCCVEGLSRDEAAAQLGVPPATLKGRLERGRGRLHDALARRGVALGAGLLALTTTSRGATASARLVKAVCSNVAGPAAPRIASLVERTAAAGVLKKALLGIVLAVATGAIGLGLGQPKSTGAGPPPEKAMPARLADKEAEKPATKPRGAAPIPVSGQVLGPDGKPVAGVKFAIIDDEVGSPVPDVVSGPDGRFAFQLPYPTGVRNPRPVVAYAPGYGIAWLKEPRDDAVFRLVPDLAIAGKVIDLEGKAVAGATVVVDNVHAGPPGAFDGLLENWKKKPDDQERAAGKLSERIWNRGGLGKVFRTTTDKDGKFELAGFGADRVVTLLITGPGLADTYAAVATRKGFDPTGSPRTPLRLYPPDCRVVVSPDKPVAGVVRDAAGTPLAGVRVAGASMVSDLPHGSYQFHAWPTPSTVSDTDGKFTLHGLSKAGSYVLVADPAEGTPHLHRFKRVEDTPAFTPIRTDFSLPRGIVMTGRVTDAVTGAGVASRVFYRPLEKNPDVYDGYDPPDLPAPWHWGRDAKTDMDGRYKITVAAGSGVMHFQAFGGSYERAKATQKDLDDGIVDKQVGSFRCRGQGGMYNPEYMNAFRVIEPKATEKIMTLDVTYQPLEPRRGDRK